MLGWPGHEHQWRGDTSLFDARIDDVAQIYQSEDSERVGDRFCDRYGIRYVYVGAHASGAAYGNGHLDEFDGLLKTAFARAGVIIYERVGLVEGHNGG